MRGKNISEYYWLSCYIEQRNISIAKKIFMFLHTSQSNICLITNPWNENHRGVGLQPLEETSHDIFTTLNCLEVGIGWFPPSCQLVNNQPIVALAPLGYGIVKATIALHPLSRILSLSFVTSKLPNIWFTVFRKSYIMKILNNRVDMLPNYTVFTG